MNSELYNKEQGIIHITPDNLRRALLDTSKKYGQQAETINHIINPTGTKPRFAIDYNYGKKIKHLHKSLSDKLSNREIDEQTYAKEKELLGGEPLNQFICTALENKREAVKSHKDLQKMQGVQNAHRSAPSNATTKGLQPTDISNSYKMRPDKQRVDIMESTFLTEGLGNPLDGILGKLEYLKHFVPRDNQDTHLQQTLLQIDKLAGEALEYAMGNSGSNKLSEEDGVAHTKPLGALHIDNVHIEEPGKTIDPDPTMTEAENYGSDKDNILKTINDYWDNIPDDKKPSYDEFNKIIPCGKNLRNSEKDNKKIGIANYDKDNEGISTLSFIATLTDLLCDKRLAAEIGKDGNITGWTWYKNKLSEAENEKVKSDNEDSTSTKRASVCLFINELKQFLLIKRGMDTTVEPGKWATVGGKVEPGEHYVEAIAREVREETQIDIPEDSYIHCYEETDPMGYNVCYFAAFLPSKTPIKLNEENTDYDWFTTDNLPPASELFTGLLKQIKHILEILSKKEETSPSDDKPLDEGTAVEFITLNDGQVSHYVDQITRHLNSNVSRTPFFQSLLSQIKDKKKLSKKQKDILDYTIKNGHTPYTGGSLSTKN